MTFLGLSSKNLKVVGEGEVFDRIIAGATPIVKLVVDRGSESKIIEMAT